MNLSVYEHSVEMDVDDHDEVNFHRLHEISFVLYFSMFVNLLDVEYYDVVMNSAKNDFNNIEISEKFHTSFPSSD
jgi:hypothetical protein